MARSLRRLVLVAAVGALVSIEVVWLAPAVLVASRVTRITGGVVQLDRVEGTLWQARGVLVAANARMPIAWRLEAWPLLRGEMRLHVQPEPAAPTGSPRADIAIGGERVAIRDAEATFPASLIVATIGAPAGWAAAGDVSISVASLEWAPPASHGEARVVWRGARLLVSSADIVVDLGDVATTLAADGDRLSGPISNTGGVLAVSGDVSLRANDAVRVSLALAPRRADDAQLAQVLSAIAAADASGWRVEWRLPLR